MLIIILGTFYENRQKNWASGYTKIVKDRVIFVDHLKFDMMKMSFKQYCLVFLLSLIAFSCSNDNVTGLLDKSGDYYVSIRQLKAYTKTEISLYYTAISQFPEYSQAGAFIGEISSGVKVSEIRYNTKLGEKDILASGLICIPDSLGEYPVLCFQNGTNVEHGQAPTENYMTPLFSILEGIASMGFIVIIPDYPGFGSSKDEVHPYLIKEHTVQSLTDILRASDEYLSTEFFDVTFNDQLFLMGYSQGAWATLQLQSEIEQNGLDGLELVASSCGAGPYDISTIFSGMLYVDQIPQPYFFAYMMNAYQTYGQMGETLDLADIFNEPYATNIPGLFDGEKTSGEINQSLSTIPAELVTADYLNGIVAAPKYQPLRESQAQNSVQAWELTTPTRLYHGDADEIVPYSISEQMKADFIQNNTSTGNIDVYTLPGMGHTDAVVPFGLQTISWFLSLKN